MKKLIVFLSLLILAVLIQLPGFALPASRETIQTGTCGSGVSWELYEDADNVYVLEVFGNGAVTEQVDLYARPARLIIGGGITSVCDRAFSSYCFEDLEEIRLPASCRQIGEEAFMSKKLQTVILPEGLQVIRRRAFFSYYAVSTACITEIPASVTEIGEGALDLLIPAVYPGTEGERYCQDYGVANYILLGGGGRLYALLEAVAQVEDVPVRYRNPVIATLQRMNLTDAQCDALRDYVLQEEAALKKAMVDNAMSVSEILGFLQRFSAAMNGIGVGVSHEIAYFNGFPGVKLTATVNGQAVRMDVYRIATHEWRVRNVDTDEANRFTYVEVTDGLMITGYDGEAASLTFPAYINGRPVVSIGRDSSYRYGYPDELASVIIPEGVRRIEAYAFAYHGNLDMVSLPDTLEEIGNYAFADCSLSEVTFGPHLRELGDCVFNGCPMATLYLPASLEALGVGYDNIVIDPSNPYLMTDSYGVLYSLQRHTLIRYPENGPANYTVQSGTLYIGKRAFEWNQTITSVTLPDGLLSVGAQAFNMCENLSSAVLPDSVTEIGMDAFNGTSLTQFHIPGSLFSDGRYDNMLEMDDLLRTAPLKSILGYGSGVRSFTVGAGNRFYSARSGVLFSADGADLILYPGSRTNTSYSVPAGTKRIVYQAFYNNQSIAMVSLPDGLLEIGDYAFFGCSSLTTVNLPGSVTRLGRACFSYTKIRNLVIPDGLTELPDLGRLTSLETLTIPASVVSWDDGWGNQVTPSQLTVYGYAGSRAEAFAGEIDCSFEDMGDTVRSVTVSRTSMTVVLGEVSSLSAQVTGSEDGTVNWTEETGRLNIINPYGGTVQFLGISTGTASLVASAGSKQAVCTVTVIMPEAATDGRTARLPEDLKAIEAGAFNGAGVTRVIIPSGAVSIGSRAFFGCQTLTAVQIPDSVTAIADNAFDGCPWVVFVCRPGSYAASYAEAHYIIHVDLN